MSQGDGIPLHIDPTLAPRYRLIQLEPGLLELLESPKEAAHLQLKSAGPDAPAFLCGYSRTFQLRQISQSNTLLLLSSASSSETTDTVPDEVTLDPLYVTKLPGGYLECIPSTPQIDLSFVPYYHGAELKEAKHSDVDLMLSRLDVTARVPVSEFEFQSAWISAMGVEIGGYAYRLSDDLVLRIVPTLMAAIQADGINFDTLRLTEVFEAIRKDEDEPAAVIEAILRRFSTCRSEPYCLDTAQLTQWLGIKMLSEHAFREIKLEDFMEKWELSLPPVLDSTCDLSMLRGQYVQPTLNTIKYLPSARLPLDPASRFERLFASKSSWLLEDMLPFLNDIEKEKVKINTLLMKFAKKKVVKGKTYIGKRGV
ncbi:sister chromatid cohesion protein Dcc1 [Lipomyces chichibuensis]|uniref:sister chromatid cohesion protein Dcc1 n=1 Tax=Lipomyces chichibuensis TaxID=1546026 RepID=UPI003343DC44